MIFSPWRRDHAFLGLLACRPLARSLLPLLTLQLGLERARFPPVVRISLLLSPPGLVVLMPAGGGAVLVVSALDVALAPPAPTCLVSASRLTDSTDLSFQSDSLVCLLKFLKQIFWSGSGLPQTSILGWSWNPPFPRVFG